MSWNKAVERSISGRSVVWSAALLALTVVALIWLQARPAPEARATDGPEPAPGASLIETATPSSVAANAAREQTRPEEAAAPPAVPPLGADELLAALRHLAQVDMQDSAALEGALLPLLAPSANVYAVLDRLKVGGLGGREHPSLEEIGALRCLTLAALLFSAPADDESTLLSAGISGDGRALVLAILRALPDVLEPVRGILADMLGNVRDANGRLVLDASYAGELERLAAEHPELAALFEGLLAGLLAGASAEDAAALQALYVGDPDSPALVAAGLARWLGENSSTALVWARETYDAEGTSEEMRHAITSAVSEAAPVAEASEFLSERAQRPMLGAFMVLGERAGAQQALEERYWHLRILGNADDRARTMLVSGMRTASTEQLLSISQEDPSSSVRAQSWTTLTSIDDFVPTQGVIERMQECWDNRDNPHLVVPTYGLITAAANFGRQAQQAPALRERASDLLRSILRDRSQSERDRRKALQELERFVSAQDFLQLSQEL
jgi:hypothetical protein